MNRTISLLVASLFVVFAPRAFADSVLDSWDTPAAQPSHRWHFGGELAVGANPFVKNDPSHLLRQTPTASLDALVGYQFTPKFELEGLAGLTMGVEGGLWALTVRPLFLPNEHWELGPVLTVGTNGLAPGVFVGLHAGLRAGPFTLAYEPLLGPGHMLDNEDEGGLVLIPLRVTLGLHF